MYLGIKNPPIEIFEPFSYFVAKQIDATKYENSNASSFSAGYPWISDRGISANALVSVDILMLRIPCQYGKMEIDALFNTTTQPTPSTSGGGGSGGSPSAPTISSVSRIARDTSNDTVRISASSGSGNSGTITYGVNTSNTAPTSFQSSTDFTQPRNSTRYYFAKQGGVASSGTQYDAAAVDTTPNAFTFTTKNSATAGQNFSQASSAISGLADGDSAAVSVSNGSVTPSSVVNGDTVTATGTAASAGNSTVVTVTTGGVQGTFTINTPAPTPSDNSPNEFGNFKLIVWRDTINDEYHFSLTKGDLQSVESPLVRVQTHSILQDTLGIEDLGKNWSIRKSIERISKEEAGLFVLINHRDAKSYWLNKLEDKEIEPKANRRVIGVGSQILRALDLKKISVLGTPTKYNAVSGFNIEITGFVNE